MIIIPMAGMSSRFFKAGYDKPKYMLEAHGQSLFEHSVMSFKAYFSTIPFVFIVKDAFDTPQFVQRKAHEMGIARFHIAVLEDDTRGQAETVALGLEQLNQKGVLHDGPITIFNIDTFRPNFKFPIVSQTSDGYLEVFYGEGDNWSFAKPYNSQTTRIAETAEKRPISNLCSTGLYHFSRKQDFLDSYNHYLARPREEWENGELYVAPLYNYLISKGMKIHYHLIASDEVIFCGVPEEYTTFLNHHEDN